MKRQNDRKLTKTDSMYVKLQQYNNSTYSSIIITAPPSADPSLLHGGGSDSTNRTKPTLQQLMFHRIVNRLYHTTPHHTIQYYHISCSSRLDLDVLLLSGERWMSGLSGEDEVDELTSSLSTLCSSPSRFSWSTCRTYSGTRGGS